MSFSVNSKGFMDFLKLCFVSGESADGSSVKYFKDCVIEIEDGEINAYMMYKTICYIHIKIPVSVVEKDIIAFSLEDMIEAIKDLEGDEISVETQKNYILVGDGVEGNKIPKKDVEGLGEYSKAVKFRERICYDDEIGFYFNATPPESEENPEPEEVTIPYDNYITINADVILGKMKRLPFFTSIYYHLKYDGDNLGLSILHAKKGIPGEKFRWVDVIEASGKFDVEYKEALQPVLKTIGNGEVTIHHTGNMGIPSLIYFEKDDIQATFIVTFRVEKKDGESNEPEDEFEDKEMDEEIDNVELEESGNGNAKNKPAKKPAKKKTKKSPKKKSG